MSEPFKVVVADDVDTDEIWVELWVDNYIFMEVLPVESRLLLRFRCNDAIVETDLQQFQEALNKAAKRARELVDQEQNM